MNFSEALKAMKMGSKVSREAWRGKISYWLINQDRQLVQGHPDGQGYFLGSEIIIQNENILADDWWIVT